MSIDYYDTVVNWGQTESIKAPGTVKKRVKLKKSSRFHGRRRTVFDHATAFIISVFIFMSFGVVMRLRTRKNASLFRRDRKNNAPVPHKTELLRFYFDIIALINLSCQFIKPTLLPFGLLVQTNVCVFATFFCFRSCLLERKILHQLRSILISRMMIQQNFSSSGHVCVCEINVFSRINLTS